MRYLISILSACLLLASCATSIPVDLVKPAEFDLKGAKTITVLPFGFPSQINLDNSFEAALFRIWYQYDTRENSRERAVAKQIEDTLVSTLLESEFFTVMRPDDLRKNLSNGDTASARSKIAADAIVTGRLASYKTSVDDQSTVDKKTLKTIVSIQCTVDMEIRYEVLLGSDGILVASRNFTVQKQGYVQDWNDIDSKTRDLTSAALEDFSHQVRRQIAPYTVREYRYLADDETKNPDMKSAVELVENKSYSQAFELYTRIYRETGNFAAGFNAAIVKEILGDLDGAIQDMQALARKSGEDKAIDELSRMKQTRAENAKAEAQRAAQNKE